MPVDQNSLASFVTDRKHCTAMACSSEQSKGTAYPSVIELNVGGHFFTTTLLTLTKQRNTMLGAMFSGMHKQPLDKDGRYFIDADGETFKWILSYLRSGELPPKEEAERVHHAALYFGLQDLVTELECMPKILAMQMKVKHQARFEGFDIMLKGILASACDVTNISDWPHSRVTVSLIHKDNVQTITGPAHICAHGPGGKKRRVTISHLVGPLEGSDVTERGYMEAVVEELVRRGFSVQLHEKGFCQAGEDNMEVMHVADGEVSCGAKIFAVVFAWR